jgi:hypothetical protein
MTPQETYETMARVLSEMDPITVAVDALLAEDERDRFGRHRRLRPITRCRACGGSGHVRSWMRFGYVMVECSLCLGSGT